MKYRLHSHRNGLFLFENEPSFRPDWLSIRDTLDSIRDEDLVTAHDAARAKRPDCKSLSDAINGILKSKLDPVRWSSESAIFNDSEYTKKGETRWRLDFASRMMAVEVAFNHGEAIAWNLLKPVLSAELNHVEKAIQTSGGVIITATEAMKRAGNFDSAVGTYEKYLRYLGPMMNTLTVPMVIIGLEPPASFALGSKSGQKGEVVSISACGSSERQILLVAEDGADYGHDPGGILP